MNKKAFTLIEVLVSVVILSTVAVYLFEISSNSKHSFSYLSKKGEFTTLSSLPLMHGEYKFNNSDKELFEYVRYSYDIKDDDLRRYLKQQKVHYEQDEFATFSPFSEGEEEIPQDQEQNQSMANFTIVFDKIKIDNKKQSTFVYKIYLR